ncbi:hypothetical protein ACO2Q1_14235 [Brevundimonas sp. VNH65]|uniref:hypothetical protein n=1 Tax=Brevundimonas sp. VNH65 TaxID=3400917 RepID=UPI003C069B47
MLEEPSLDPTRQTLDGRLIDALSAALAHRAAAGPTSPDAEALMLRGLIAQAGDPGRKALLLALFGRLSAQGGAAVIAAGPAAQTLAADRFGPMQAVDSPEAALDAVTPDTSALIDLGGGRPWWGRLLARPDLRVVGALPDAPETAPRALLVGAARPGPTGDDRTFWVTDATLPDARIVETLAALGLSARPLAASGGLKLFVLAGYVQGEDGRLDQAPGSLKGVIGAAPVF